MINAREAYKKSIIENRNIYIKYVNEILFENIEFAIKEAIKLGRFGTYIVFDSKIQTADTTLTIQERKLIIINELAKLDYHVTFSNDNTVLFINWNK